MNQERNLISNYIIQPKRFQKCFDKYDQLYSHNKFVSIIKTKILNTMIKKPIKISTDQLVDYLNDLKGLIIDVRPVEAYNGWTLMNESRGGHIKRAKSLPLKWSKYIDWQEIVRSKGITPEKQVVVYGYSSKESMHVALLLMQAGFQDVMVYDHFADEWCPDPALPMNKLERYEQLIYPGWLHELISNDKPVGMEKNNFVICHAHYDNPGDYDEGHIPGAVSLDTMTLESPETWNRRTSEELKESLQRLGIRYNTTVILYGRFSFPDNNYPFPGKNAGHLAAMRCAVIMMYAGVNDVRILNGGLLSWIDAGYEVSKIPYLPVPVSDFGKTIPAHPEYIIDTPEAKSLLASDHGRLVSVRSWEEFIGNVSGYNYISKKGRIPGAVFGNCGSDAYHMENYRNLDHTMAEYHEILQSWAKMGIGKENRIAFYCGTGWRASEAFMHAYLMGWPEVSVYDGGWFEWSNDPGNPVEIGEPAGSLV